MPLSQRGAPLPARSFPGWVRLSEVFSLMLFSIRVQFRSTGVTDTLGSAEVGGLGDSIAREMHIVPTKWFLTVAARPF